MSEEEEINGSVWDALQGGKGTPSLGTDAFPTSNKLPARPAATAANPVSRPLDIDELMCART